MSINSISDVGERFGNFVNEVGKHDVQRTKDIESGLIKTKEQLNARYVEDSSMSFDVLPDEWRILANKKDKSSEEFNRMEKMYREGFLQLGNSYVQYIDKKYGNGDGKLSVDEYVNMEFQTLPEDLRQFADRSDAENIIILI